MLNTNCTLPPYSVLMAVYTKDHPEWFEADGVHPSNEGAAAIAQEVYAVINSK